MGAPAHKSLLVRNIVSFFYFNFFTHRYVEVTVIRGRLMVWPLTLCPDDAKQDPVVYGAELA